MNTFIRLGVLAVCLCFNHAALPQSDAPLVQKQHLVYEGAFRLPGGSSDSASFSWGGTSLAFNAANDSLFITGHDHYQYTAEVKIPALGNSADIGNLPIAAMLQGFQDPTEGRLRNINPSSDPNNQKVGGHLVYDGKLYLSGYTFYDGAGSQTSSHFVRPLSLSTTGQVQGPFKVGGQYPGFVSGYMTLIPPEWQAQFGGPALTGNCCLSIAGIQSNGPAASVFDPTRLGSSNTTPATPVVGYPIAHHLGPGEDRQNPYYNLTTKIRGIVFPAGTRSVLFFGRHGTGPYCYGTGSACNDPVDGTQGTHAYPYVYQIWAYDANDLLRVRNGSRDQYDVQPYSIWTFNLPYEADDDHMIGGAAYDPQTARVYVSQQCKGSSCEPIIHALRIEVARTVAPPMPPSGLVVE